VGGRERGFFLGGEGSLGGGEGFFCGKEKRWIEGGGRRKGGGGERRVFGRSSRGGF